MDYENYKSPKMSKAINKPSNANFYGWNKFCKWAKRVGVNLNCQDDWFPWWDCWTSAYIAGMNGDS